MKPCVSVLTIALQVWIVVFWTRATGAPETASAVAGGDATWPAALFSALVRWLRFWYAGDSVEQVETAQKRHLISYAWQSERLRTFSVRSRPAWRWRGTAAHAPPMAAFPWGTL